MLRIFRSPRLSAAIIATLLVAVLNPPYTQAQRKEHAAPWVGQRLDGKDCESVQVGFGPFDYLQRYQNLSSLQVVEESHFDEGVENLTRGMTTTPIGDIHYTLSAWPNHHRALKSALDYRLKHPKWPKESRGVPAECYLLRAMRFSPKDGTPYLMFGILAHRQKQYEPALEAYRQADKLLPNDMAIKYNMGLTLTKLKQFKEARELAELVYANDFPLPGLKNRLIAAGQWPKDKMAGKEPLPIPYDSTVTNPAPTVKRPVYTDAQLASMIEKIKKQAAQEKEGAETETSP